MRKERKVGNMRWTVEDWEHDRESVYAQICRDQPVRMFGIHKADDMRPTYRSGPGYYDLDRAIDRWLQELRRAGRIYYDHAAGWRVTEVSK